MKVTSPSMYVVIVWFLWLVNIADGSTSRNYSAAFTLSHPIPDNVFIQWAIVDNSGNLINKTSWHLIGNLSIGSHSIVFEDIDIGANPYRVYLGVGGMTSYGSTFNLVISDMTIMGGTSQFFIFKQPNGNSNHNDIWWNCTANISNCCTFAYNTRWESFRRDLNSGCNNLDFAIGLYVIFVFNFFQLNQLSVFFDNLLVFFLLLIVLLFSPPFCLIMCLFFQNVCLGKQTDH